MPTRNGTEEENRSELLETGLFGDVTVSCGSKTWKLHKAILCSASTFFKKALTGNWEEAKNGHVTIHEVNPDHVGWIITLVYTKDLPERFKSLASEETKEVPAYGDLFAIADYLGVERGMKLAVNHLKTHLAQKAASIQAAYHFQNEKFDQSEYGSRESIQALFDTIAMAYDNPSPTFQPMRDTFVDFFRQTRYVVVRHERYREGLFRVPELARDVLFELVPSQSRNPHSSQVLFSTPPRCLLCYGRAYHYTDVWISKTARGIKGLCGSCEAAAHKRESYQRLLREARQLE